VQNQKEQKRNAYAVSVWRIRMKLEERHPDPNKWRDSDKQVDWMIREGSFFRLHNLTFLLEILIYFYFIPKTALNQVIS
jgi:hypothetical protein